VILLLDSLLSGMFLAMDAVVHMFHQSPTQPWALPCLVVCMHVCVGNSTLTTVSAVNGAITAMAENGVDLGQIVKKNTVRFSFRNCDYTHYFYILVNCLI